MMASALPLAVVVDDQPAAFPETATSPVGGASSAVTDADLLAAIALSEYTNRRRRDRLMSAVVSAEPAWDILLDLYVQAHRGQLVSVYSLCVASSVPQTTALRWIARLDKGGYIVRTPSEADNRVTNVALSEKGRRELDGYLSERLQDIRESPVRPARHGGEPLVALARVAGKPLSP